MEAKMNKISKQAKLKKSKSDAHVIQIQEFQTADQAEKKIISG